MYEALSYAGDRVRVMHKDFLQVDVTREPFCRVEAIMLDPSCSGSGIRGRAGSIRLLTLLA